MTVITYPGNIANGDTPDWDLVYAYFTAVKAAAETTGWDNNNIKAAAGIAYTKLNLTDKIVTADIKNAQVNADKMATPTVTTDTLGSNTNNGVINVPFSSLCSVQAPSTGYYDITAVARLRCASGTTAGALAEMQAYLTVAGSQVGPTYNAEQAVSSSGYTGCTHLMRFTTVVNYNQVVTFKANFPSTGLNNNIVLSGSQIRIFRIA